MARCARLMLQGKLPLQPPPIDMGNVRSQVFVTISDCFFFFYMFVYLFPLFFLFFSLICLVLLHPFQEIGVMLSGCGTAPVRAVVLSHISVCGIFVSKQWHGCQHMGFLTCARSSACDCTQRLYRHHKGVNSQRRIPCHTGDLNPRQYCIWLFH